MKPVNILGRIERADNRPFVNLRGRRRLDEDAIDGGIAIEFFDFCQQLCLACIRGQL